MLLALRLMYYFFFRAAVEQAFKSSVPCQKFYLSRYQNNINFLLLLKFLNLFKLNLLRFNQSTIMINRSENVK